MVFVSLPTSNTLWNLTYLPCHKPKVPKNLTILRPVIMESLTHSAIRLWLVSYKPFQQLARKNIQWAITRLIASMQSKRLIMKWKKLSQLRQSPTRSKSQSSLLKTKLPLNQLSKPRFKPIVQQNKKLIRLMLKKRKLRRRLNRKMIKLLKRKLPQDQIEHLRLDLMHTKIISQTRRLTKLFHLSTVRTLVGKLMYASCQRVTPIMVPIVWPKRKLKISPNLTINLTLTSKKEEKDSSLERKEASRLVRLCLRYSSGSQTSLPLMRFQITWFQINTISEALMALISPIHWEIKELVDPATLCHSLKSLSQDLSKDMVRKFQFFLHNILWCATISMKVATEAGPSSTASWLRMVTSYQRNVHHTRQRLRATNARIMSTASQLQRSSRATSSAVPMASHPRRRWWKKFLETVS